MSQIIVRMKDSEGSSYWDAENFRIESGINSSHYLLFEMVADSKVVEECYFFSRDKERLE